MHKREETFRIQVCNSHRPKVHGGGCCNDKGAAELLQNLQKLINERGLDHQVEVLESPCLRNCLAGISVRILPDMTTYSRVKIQDLEEIVSQHLLQGKPVKSLQAGKSSILNRF